jgi:YggT family protein
MNVVLITALTRNDIADYVSALFRVYVLILIAYIVVNLFFSFGGRMPYSGWSRAILDFLRDVSEPVLAPFRRVIPPLGPLDLSPMIAIILLGIVGNVIASLIRG